MSKCVDCGVDGQVAKLGHPGVRCVPCFDARVKRMGMVKCSGCNKPAVGQEIGGTPLCDECAARLRSDVYLALGKEPSPYPGIGMAIGHLVEEKQAAYGDSFGKSGEVMALLYPYGIPLAQLDDALTVVRVVDKLFRVATDRDALGEDPWRDIAGYGLLSVRRNAVKAETAEREKATAVSKEETS